MARESKGFEKLNETVKGAILQTGLVDPAKESASGSKGKESASWRYAVCLVLGVVVLVNYWMLADELFFWWKAVPGAGIVTQCHPYQGGRTRNTFLLSVEFSTPDGSPVNTQVKTLFYYSVNQPVSFYYNHNHPTDARSKDYLDYVRFLKLFISLFGTLMLIAWGLPEKWLNKIGRIKIKI